MRLDIKSFWDNTGLGEPSWETDENLAYYEIIQKYLNKKNQTTKIVIIPIKSPSKHNDPIRIRNQRRKLKKLLFKPRSFKTKLKEDAVDLKSLININQVLTICLCL